LLNQTAPIVWPGKPYPLRAIWDGEDVNFAIFSEHAEKVDLRLFHKSGLRELHCVSLSEQTDQVWHWLIAGSSPGQLWHQAQTALTTEQILLSLPSRITVLKIPRNGSRTVFSIVLRRELSVE
jgi:hypothetical protein